jgi:SAM-dependent methyltransferase
MTGVAITREAASMMWTRYATAADRAAGKDVLEVGCGTGQGVGYLARQARRVVGGDYTLPLVQQAERHQGTHARFVCLDGQKLPFADASFDLVLLYEVIYYLPDASAFVRECRRVLRPGGTLIVTTANRERDSFNPSPFSHRYYAASEFGALLGTEGFRTEVYGAFPDEPAGPLGQAIGQIRRVAVALHLIPETMRAKELLKRLFYGKLVTLGSELPEGVAEREPLVPLDGTAPAPGYKVIYAIGTLPA